VKNISEIKSRSELADFLGVPGYQLSFILFIKKPESFYRTFEIPKKSGSMRQICAPTGILKSLQKKLAKRLWNKIKADRFFHNIIRTNISHAFEKNKSIITNARVHRNKKFVLNLDLENFFDSFHFGRIVGYFEKNRDFKLPHEIAVALAQLVCYNNRLPQGAPTSPVITNLICQIMDYRLLKIAKKYKLDFTRYADDLSFSTNHKDFLNLKDLFLKEITAEIEKAGFTVNNKKTRLLYNDARQEVTGLVVNKKIGVKHEFVKNTRAMAHQLYTTGNFMLNGRFGNLKQLEGRFSFIDQLDVYNRGQAAVSVTKGRQEVVPLNKREREYQKFLFYKYFFANDKPLIITEGKTDIVYLKAALKNLYASYPELIEKKRNNKFLYKVAFFNRKKKHERLLGVNQDGADSLTNLFFYFTDRFKMFTNYLKYFTDLSNKEQKHAVIFLLDNEIGSTDAKKPLRKFVNAINVSNADKEVLKKNLQLHLIPKSKLYLVTNPLVKGKTECEIEDLFSDEVLATVIKGKTFCRSSGFDKEKHYGKQIFSKYVCKNYRKIDFTGFMTLLDTIKALVVSAEEEYVK
jgi:hypothetical protein